MEKWHRKFLFSFAVINETVLLRDQPVDIFGKETSVESPGGGALPYMGYIGMCRCEGYGFQAVYSRIGYIHQSVWA